MSLIPPHWIASTSVSELSIKTTFGSELFLVGLDAPQRIEGLILDGGVIDENSDIKPGVFDLSILPTLVWRDGWTDFIGVPKRFGIGAVEYREKCEKAASGGLPDAALFHWASEGIVPAEFLEMCRETMDARDFDEQFNASWLSASGGIFHAFDREFNVRPCQYLDTQPIIVGMDFNVDPMAWVLCHDKGGVLECFDEIWLRNTNTSAALNVLTGRYPNHKGGWLFYGDASSRARETSAYSTDFIQIAENDLIKAMGRTLHFDTSNPPVADRFAATNAHICTGVGVRRLFVSPSCPNLIRDLETRSYKPGTRDTDDTGDQGHITDALGYIIHKRWPLQLVIQNSQIITLHTGV
ncbi:hypothetical protein LCGC14_0561410 [marine sediment metagenome]|uniref:Terminase large subunit gp17-like C-terminal domain-containing protein n=1 Tax=marine sediment metagenome TaxID=412755 RepID=A0A0F9RS27_9ZZZZ